MKEEEHSLEVEVDCLQVKELYELRDGDDSNSINEL